MGIRHAKTSSIADGSDPDLVLPSDWNADHVLPEGSSFPGSPSVGDRFYRTDRHLEYFYDGTRWLSTQLFTVPWVTRALIPVTASNSLAHGVVPSPGIVIETFSVVSYMSVVANASNYWTVNLAAHTQPSVSTIFASVNTLGNAVASNWYRQTVSPAAYVDSSHIAFYLNIVETGNGGTIYIGAEASYRLVG